MEEGWWYCSRTALVESNTVIQNQIFISYANNPGIPFPVVQFESLGSKTMVSVVPNPPVHVC